MANDILGYFLLTSADPCADTLIENVYYGNLVATVGVPLKFQGFFKDEVTYDTNINVFVPNCGGFTNSITPLVIKRGHDTDFNEIVPYGDPN